MTASPYLATIMNDLVNGNAANATWTGGAAASTHLGNLAVGSSATQFSELIGKWFLGSDLPSSTVAMSGYPSFAVQYSAVRSPVFAPSGPSMSDINQGYLGDCYFLSCLAEVAKQNSGIIKSMFAANGNNTYGVRFYVDGSPEYVTVNNSLADGGQAFNYGANMWASLAEKAYTQLQSGGVVTGNSINYGNSWSTIGNGGAPEYALEEITGTSAITDFSAYYGSWGKIVYNSSLAVTSVSTGISTGTVLSTLVSDLAKGDDLILSSYTNATDSSGKTTPLLTMRCRFTVTMLQPVCLKFRIPGEQLTGRLGTPPSRSVSQPCWPPAIPSPLIMSGRLSLHQLLPRGLPRLTFQSPD